MVCENKHETGFIELKIKKKKHQLFSKNKGILVAIYCLCTCLKYMLSRELSKNVFCTFGHKHILRERERERYLYFCKDLPRKNKMALANLPTSKYTLCRILNTEIYEHTSCVLK